MRERTLAFLVLGLFATALTACGVGAATDEENVSKTATTYLRALPDGDTAKDGAQPTPPRERQKLRRDDEGTPRPARPGCADRRGRRLDGHRPRRQQGHNRLSKPEGARFLLAKVGGQ